MRPVNFLKNIIYLCLGTSDSARVQGINDSSSKCIIFYTDWDKEISKIKGYGKKEMQGTQIKNIQHHMVLKYSLKIFLNFYFIYLFLAAPSLCCFCTSWGPCSVATCRGPAPTDPGYSKERWPRRLFIC